VENIVNAILGEIVAALCPGGPARLLRRFQSRTPGPYRPRSGTHVTVDPKSVPLFEAGKEMRLRLSREQSGEGTGILKVAKSLGFGTGTVQRIKQEMISP
jgi:integration host factor subunit beta